ncbi:MAG TPA: nuclear transport factor 2 family protein [Solirubrobacterales bacterium]|nr:nuclear transport factor 2 family protein [Solirubrobacterales bacterium]
MTGAERVRAYYEDLNKGSAKAVSAHFTEDATHYYTRLGPHEGAETTSALPLFRSS